MGVKCLPIVDSKDSGIINGYMIECPACRFGHAFYVRAIPNGMGGTTPVWQFNGNMERPTFRASMKVTYGPRSAPQICHSFVTDGRIEFCGDCTHPYRGQTLDLPDMDGKAGDSR